MTPEERVSSLHKRMEARRCTRERRKTGAIGAFNALLAVCLLLLIWGEGKAHCGSTADLYSGATMLLEGAGGYVLVSVVSFAAAVVITVTCIRFHRKQKERTNPDRTNNGKREDKDHE